MLKHKDRWGYVVDNYENEYLIATTKQENTPSYQRKYNYLFIMSYI